jgi:hypothetical protein
MHVTCRDGWGAEDRFSRVRELSYVRGQKRWVFGDCSGVSQLISIIYKAISLALAYSVQLLLTPRCGHRQRYTCFFSRFIQHPLFFAYVLQRRAAFPSSGLFVGSTKARGSRRISAMFHLLSGPDQIKNQFFEIHSSPSLSFQALTLLELSSRYSSA